MQVPCRGHGPPPQAREFRYRVDNAQRIHYLKYQTMSEQYKSEMLAAIHETALGLHEADVLNKMTMRMFDEMCLTPVKDGTDTANPATRKG